MVKVRYYRPGKEPREWDQELVAETERAIVSSFVFRLEKPFSPFDEVLIEDGYRGILIDLLDEWYNVVKIYDRLKNFQGYYSDIRTPPKIIEGGYEARDLFLDVWVDPEGVHRVLDLDEFEEAELPHELRGKAEDTLERLEEMIEKGEYPPGIAIEYGLDDL